MNCPACGRDEDRVVDSRFSADHNTIRRRRECATCGRRFTTYERLEGAALEVIKSDGRRQPWDRGRVLEGVQKACEKRPVSARAMSSLTDRVEDAVADRGSEEVSTKEIGELVMRRLKRLDSIAYVRYACHYLDYDDLTDFVSELERLTGTREE